MKGMSDNCKSNKRVKLNHVSNSEFMIQSLKEAIDQNKKVEFKFTTIEPIAKHIIQTENHITKNTK